MARIFISHSKEDRDLTSNIKKLLVNIGETPVLMEYNPKMDSDVPPWEVIKEEVKESEYMMLFKTENAIKTDYTKNWISYEVGLAAAWNKRLFIFERRGPPIHFPIPYLTDYMIFNPQEVSDMLKLQSVAKEFKETKFEDFKEKPKDDKTDDGLAALALILFAPVIIVAMLHGTLKKALRGPIPITCDKCHSNYNYYASVFDSFNCPVCLTLIDISSKLDDKSINLLRFIKNHPDFENTFTP